MLMLNVFFKPSVKNRAGAGRGELVFCIFFIIRFHCANY